MTRLTRNHLMGIDLYQYDQKLQEKTGKNLVQLAWEFSGLSRPFAELQGEKVAVVPVTAGKGVISGFTEAVSSILRHLGLNAVVTVNTDIAGIGEALSRGATVTFCADDSLFLAIDFRSGRYVDNTKATAGMFMFAVEQMAAGLRGKKVLIIGLGKVGDSCLYYAYERNATISVYDIEPQQCEEVNKKYPGVAVDHNLEKMCSEAEIVIDASPGEEFIPAAWLRDDVFIGAPGVPLGLTDAAYQKFRKRVVYDPLALGVAGMVALIFAVKYA